PSTRRGKRQRRTGSPGSVDSPEEWVIASPIMESRPGDLTNAVLACLFAAFISLGAYIAIPLPGTPVPIVLQNFFIILASSTLGPWWGLLSVGIYLVFGFVGLPVLSGGTGGPSRFLGPTGGYLLGYIPAALAIGFISRRGKGGFLSQLLAGFAGMAIVYSLGMLRLKSLLQLDWNRTIATGFLPFLPGDLLKIVLAAWTGPRLRSGIASLETRSPDD
ncbi:MAG TPA: biotin transporter BioY, partial [Rectinemataceae bacterium]